MAFAAQVRALTHLGRQRGRGGAQQITEGDGVDDYPTFSPDGSEIVFASTRGGDRRWHLYSTAVDGERLTSGAGDEVYPAWSPTGAGRVLGGLGSSGDISCTLRSDSDRWNDSPTTMRATCHRTGHQTETSLRSPRPDLMMCGRSTSLI